MDLEKLRRRVEWSTRVAFVVFALVFMAYAAKLWLLSGGKIAEDPAIWGQFGDYVGGLLNPLIAFLAFYWLTQSVILQKEELADTRAALVDSAGSQSKQVRLAARTAEINALSALLSSYNSDLSRLYQESQYLSDQFVAYERRGVGPLVLLGGRTVVHQQALDVAAEIEKRLIGVTNTRQDVILKISRLLEPEIDLAE